MVTALVFTVRIVVSKQRKEVSKFFFLLHGQAISGSIGLFHHCVLSLLLYVVAKRNSHSLGIYSSNWLNPTPCSFLLYIRSFSSSQVTKTTQYIHLHSFTPSKETKFSFSEHFRFCTLSIHTYSLNGFF